MTPNPEDVETKPLDFGIVDITKKSDVNLEEALEDTGFGKYNILVIFVCGLVLFAANCECYGIGFIVPAAECELHLDSYKKGLLTSANLIGLMISCAVWGYISDIKGRRNLLFLHLIGAFLTGSMAAVSSSFWGFCILRFLNGLCISGPAAIIFVYFGEFLNNSTKAMSTAWLTTFVALAMMYLPSLGWFLLQQVINVEFLGLRLTNWRLFMLINSLPNAIAAVGLTMLPESPKYLYHTGKYREALVVLRKMYSYNTGRSNDAFPVENLDDKILLEIDRNSKRSISKYVSEQILPLLKPPLLIYTLSASFMQAASFAIGSGLYAWYPDIIAHLSGDGSLTICEALSFNQTTDEDSAPCDAINDRVFILNIIIGVYYLVAYVVWGVVVKALGIKNFFIICTGIPAFALAVLCYISKKILIDILFVTILVLPGIGITVINVWVVDIFPTYICGMAICLTLTFGRLGSVVSSSVAGLMLEWSCQATFMLYALSLFACMAVSLLLPQKK